MAIIFSENVIIQFFDNHKLYKPKIRKIKTYDGPNDFSILWNQLLILLHQNIIYDSYSLKGNFNESIIKIYSQKIIEEINQIIYKFSYKNQKTISLYYGTYQLNNTKEFTQKLFLLKDILQNL
tara:strand:- start:512 stop:880 length:369 start_codon:yes stop_codon:yes gene_type:complete